MSRPLKQFSESNRPSDWFAQKNCALQYSEMRESVKDEVPKRKRGERQETAEEVIVRKLRLERIDELKKMIAVDKANVKRAIDEADMANSSHPNEAVLRKIWERMKAEQKQSGKLVQSFV